MIGRGDRGQFRERHIVDSLRGATLLGPGPGRVVDLGSGAGLPGVPLAIARQDLTFCLADLRKRRVAFMELAVDSLGLSNVTVFAGKVEQLTGRFDGCLSRAFAEVDRAWTIAERLLSPTGKLLFWAGRSFDVGAGVPAGARMSVSACTRPCGCRACRYHEPAVSKPSPDATSSSPRSDKGTQGPATGKDEVGRSRRQAPRQNRARRGSSPSRTRRAALANQPLPSASGPPWPNSASGSSSSTSIRRGTRPPAWGYAHEARGVTVYDVVLSEAPVESAIVPTSVKHLDAVPSTIDLAGAEIELVSQFSRETRLKKALAPVGEGRYDFIFLDCPPSLGLLTINALTAAEELIVPIQCEYYALEGLGQLLRNVNLVQQNINPELRLTGIVMTMFDPRTKLSEQVVEEVRRFFGEVVYDVVIPRTVRLSEAPGFGQPITVYDPRSKGAESYRQLAREVAARPRPDSPMPVFDDLPSVVVQAPSGDAGGTPSDEIPRRRSRTRSPTAAPTSQMEAVAEPEPAPEPDPQSEPELAPSQTRGPSQSPRPTRRWPQPQRIWGPARFRPHRRPRSRWTRNRIDRARSGGPTRWRRQPSHGPGRRGR